LEDSGERIAATIGRGELLRLVEMRTRDGIQLGVQLDDAFGKQVIHSLAILGNVCGEHMVETAIFTDNHDHVFDGRRGFTVVWGTRLRLRDANRKFRKGEASEPGT
jgi:hypothetical protein